jgi:hypothetical protein
MRCAVMNTANVNSNLFAFGWLKVCVCMCVCACVCVLLIMHPTVSVICCQWMNQSCFGFWCFFVCVLVCALLCALVCVWCEKQHTKHNRSLNNNKKRLLMYCKQSSAVKYEQELIQFWVCTYGGILINKNESIQTFLLIKNTIISRD